MPPSAGLNSASSTLLDQLRARQPEAWGRFVRIYSALIYGWCRRSGLPAEDSADVLQEVLLAVLRHLADFHRDRIGDSFIGWLAAITRNKVRDHCRRRHGLPDARGGSTAQRQMGEIAAVAEQSEVFIRPDAQTAAWLSHGALELIRAEFEPQTWEAFRRTTLERQRAADVAADLQLSVAAVYTAKSRVLRRLRQTLGQLPP